MTNIFSGGPNGEAIGDTADDDNFAMGGGDDIVTWRALGGVDTFGGGPDSDTLVVDVSGQSKSAYLITGNGNLYLESRTSNNRATFGGFEHYIVTGGSGSDDLRGANGADRISGGGGNDQVWGDWTGSGSFHEADIIDGGKGLDTWHDHFNERALGIVADLRILSTRAGGTLDDGSQIRRVEAAVLQMTQGDDRFHDKPGVHMNDVIEGLAGDDLARFTGGRDQFFGSTGVDTAVVDYRDAAKVVHLSATQAWVGADFASASDRVGFGLVEHYRVIGGSRNDRMFSAGGDDRLDGRDGNDTLSGNAGADILLGGKGSDTLAGGGGDDRLNGGKGADAMSGSVGDDLYVVDNAGDVVTELANQGTDKVRASVSYSLNTAAAAGVEVLALTGGGDLDGEGNALANQITGTKGDNELRGLGGDDVLTGLKGRDTLEGGAGADMLNGGGGGDDFVFAAAAESVAGAMDTIVTWTKGDHVVLSGIDANTGAGHDGDDAFALVAAHSGAGGTLRVFDDGTDTFVGGDTTGDGADDFLFRILRLVTFTTADFDL